MTRGKIKNRLCGRVVLLTAIAGAGMANIYDNPSLLDALPGVCSPRIPPG